MVDVLLVGDSLNQVLAGHETTLSATLEQMIYHAASVRRGTRQSLLFVDLPFLTYQVTVEEALRNAGRVMKETGAHGVKLEGGEYMAETIRAMVQVGIPVMAHIGLTPQSVHQLGGYRVQGRERPAADRLRSDATCPRGGRRLCAGTRAGALSAGRGGQPSLQIPTIGIGAGPGCDGQVLVLHDMLGLNPGFAPKFLRKYAELATTVQEAARQYAEDVRAGRYPGREHSFD